MSGRAAGWISWSVWAVTLVLLVLTVVFSLVYPTSEDRVGNPVNFAVLILFVATFETVGAIIASRRPKNAIGWVFCGMGLALVGAVFCGNYAQYALVVEPGALPGGATAAWVTNWIWLVALSPLGFFLLLFPDGRSPSPRWRFVGWLLGVGLGCWTVSQALVPGPMFNAGYESVDNPYGVGTAGGVLRTVGGISAVVVLAAVLASTASLFVRFRRSRGDERRQIEWVAYAGALMVLVLVLQLIVEAMLPEAGLVLDILSLGLLVALTTVPIAAGVAILKYRLYDIDLIINRTLVYGALTATLSLSYLGGVVTLQTLFRSLTGQGSQLAIVASTLAIAALFSPLRRRVQNFVDRRFYRKKYDARRTLEAFSARLRDETDLDALGEDLVGVVEETMRPVHARLWLRPAARGEEG